MNEPLDQIREIRSMLERSSRFLSLSGLSGISAGICGLLGAWHVHQNIMSWDLNQAGDESKELIIRDAIVVLGAASVLVIFFSLRRVKLQGQKVSGPAVRQLLKTLAIPLITGGVLCLGLVAHGNFAYGGALSMIFYGLALVTASRHTVSETYSLGLIQILLGLAAFFFPEYGLLLWVIGFGGLHIIYGLVMYLKYERV